MRSTPAHQASPPGRIAAAREPRPGSPPARCRLATAARARPSNWAEGAALPGGPDEPIPDTETWGRSETREKKYGWSTRFLQWTTPCARTAPGMRRKARRREKPAFARLKAAGGQPEWLAGWQRRVVLLQPNCDQCQALI